MGLFKKKDGTNTKFGGIFKNKDGGKSLFGKIANTVLDVAEFIPVAGTAVKGARVAAKGVKLATAGAKAIKALKTVSKVKAGVQALGIGVALPVNNKVIVPDALVNYPQSEGTYNKGAQKKGFFESIFQFFGI